MTNPDLFIDEMDPDMETYRVTLEIKNDLSLDQVVLFEEGLGDLALSSSFFRSKYSNALTGWVLHWVMAQDISKTDVLARLLIVKSQHKIDDVEIELRDISIEQIEKVNWLEQCYQQFPPFNIGPFYIYGSHYDGEIDAGQMGLQIDAAIAFGSGEHGTTAGCLKALSMLKDQGFVPSIVLDLGTGSGILAIGASKLWADNKDLEIIASDIEEDSVKMTKHHAQINDVPDGIIHAVLSDGFSHSAIKKNKPYDMIIANILAGPLIEMSYDLCAHMKPNGVIVLSGLLTTQKTEVLSAYNAEEFDLVFENDIEEWSTLVLKRMH